VEFVERNVAGTVVYAMGYARVVALLGPRQAGKSTLARKLAGEHSTNQLPSRRQGQEACRAPL